MHFGVTSATSHCITNSYEILRKDSSGRRSEEKCSLEGGKKVTLCIVMIVTLLYILIETITADTIP